MLADPNSKPMDIAVPKNVGLTFREVTNGVDVAVGEFSIDLARHRRVYRKFVAYWWPIPRTHAPQFQTQIDEKWL